jgi:ribonuclease HII
VTATAFLGPRSLAEEDWWQCFDGLIGRATTRHPLIVDDSKRVLTIADGHSRLAEAVHAFFFRAGCPHLNIRDLYAYLDLEGALSLAEEHWFDPSEPCPDLYTQPAACADVLVELDKRHQLTLAKICCRAVFPREFNCKLESLGNKAAVELEVIRDLLRHTLRTIETEVANIVVWVDRLGGRRYYQALVEEVADGPFVAIVNESPKCSTYRYVDQGREVEMTFRVNGDGHYLPVALASMISKYLRERSMAHFNAYWAKVQPGLTPTAGYPGDSRRFLKAVKRHLRPAGITMDTFWRRK